MKINGRVVAIALIVLGVLLLMLATQIALVQNVLNQPTPVFLP